MAFGPRRPARRSGHAGRHGVRATQATYTFPPMSRWLVEKRLSQSAERLKQLRAELKVVDEQLLFFAEAADEARLRALVSETPLADKEHRDAQKHAEAMTRRRTEIVGSIHDLERAQDELLDKLAREAR